ncbi:MAG: metal-dependent hydrolase [Alcanivoracaceae bacterium]|nr:metal-dependent hydrolase [Alcanivoracaceae bacterium]
MTAVAAIDQASKKSARKGEAVGVPVRRLGQTYDDAIPDFWFRNNAFLSMFFTGFSATLPEGEDQFIYSVRLFQKKITNPVLKAQVRAFIGQEAHHSKEHDALNETLKKRGYPLGWIENRIRKLNRLMRKHQSPQKQLAGTVCGEHITALMSDYMLGKRPELLEQMAPAMEKMWAWHAIEETEHKGVAFDVYDQLVGDRNLLRRTMMEVTFFFLILNTTHALALMRQTGQMKNWRMWREALGVLGRMGRELRADYMDFYRKDYHPWQHDNRDVLAAARKKYLGEDS